MNDVSKYRVVHYYSNDDACFLAVIPDLPGCIADGATVEEAVANVRELAQDWIDIAIENEEPVPEPSFQKYPAGNSVSIFDVALYILEAAGTMTTMALQKLLYYCKAWSLGWFGVPLFPESFEAWVNGPVNRALYNKHSGSRLAKPVYFAHFSSQELSPEQKSFINKILSVYQDIDADDLGNMTHKELPWINARGNCAPRARCSTEISDADMISYYH